MSAAPAATAAAAPDATDAVPVNKGKKKLIVIAAGLALLLAIGAGAGFYVYKKRAAAAAAAADSEGEGPAATEVAEANPLKADVKHAPTFLPLEPFTVNLADRDAERYAQVGITLELTDAKSSDVFKAYMPAIRNNILLALGSKTAAQLMERDGKLRLAAELRREALRPLGYEITPDSPMGSASTAGAKKALRVADDDDAPLRAVHFSNFIIQ